MKGYLRVGEFRILGAAFYLHWGILVVVGILVIQSFRSPLTGLVLLFSYFSIITIHEIGHALMARRFGSDVYAIRIGVLHGNCEYEIPYSEKEDVLIAWGGVLAQLAIAIPVIVILNLTPLGEIVWFSIAGFFLGYMNLVIALFNLLPINGLDGEKAWQIVPILLNR